jgi:ribosome maturation factor RimP
MTTPPDLARLLRDEIDRLGFELVDVRVGGPPHRRHLAVRIDRPGSQPGAGVTSEDCTSVTRALLAWFPTARPGEVLDGIEVSSPGIERPLRWIEHWRRYIGSRVRVRAGGLAGRRTGVIASVPDDGHVTVEFEELGGRTLALDDIQEAVLVVEWPKRRQPRET